MKKNYVKPEARVYEMEPCVLLAASNPSGQVSEGMKEDNFEWEESTNSDQPTEN